MNNSRRKIVVGFVFLALGSITKGQNPDPKFEIGAGISSFIYQGDLTPNRFGSVETMRFGINLQGSIIVSRSFLLRTNLAIGGLRGDDATYNNPEFRKQRNFNFRTPVTELSQMVVWNPLSSNYSNRGFSPYLFGGVGVSFLKIKRDRSNLNAAYFGDQSDILQRIALDEAHSLPVIIPVIPLGLGMRLGLSPLIDITAESSYRLVFTDYLDGFSQAANPARNDHFQTITLGAIYRMGNMNKNKLGCPVIAY